MRVSTVEFGATTAGAAPRDAAALEHDPVRGPAEALPRPVRFLGAGGFGLITNLPVFTAAIDHGLHPLAARLVAPAAEAMRYVAVARPAQAVSYLAFAALNISALAAVPQLAVMVGTSAGALVSDVGRSLFAFRPHNSAP